MQSLSDSLHAPLFLHTHTNYSGNCTYEATGEVNSHIVQPILSELVKTAFFRYFKVRVPSGR